MIKLWPLNETSVQLMKTVVAFFKLIRWPNLVFILLTQCLFYFCVYRSLVVDPLHVHNYRLFGLLCLASVLIAAAGYIINDYFDLQIDAINKPQKVVVDKLVKRRWAIIWHLILSGAGILISIYVSYKSGSKVIAAANLICVLLLWFYSTTFKKRNLSGNIIIAALTAWVIVVIYFFCGAGIDLWPNHVAPYDAKRFFSFTILYAGFAFIVSLIREVIKDMEDRFGDAKYHSRTMPIVWGIQTSKVFTGVWLVVCIAGLLLVQLYAWQLGWWIIAVYTLFCIVLPLLLILHKLYRAITPQDFHRLSTLIKLVMLAGILSMLFFVF